MKLGLFKNIVNKSKRLLDRSQYFKMIEGNKVSELLPRGWKKTFDG